MSKAVALAVLAVAVVEVASKVRIALTARIVEAAKVGLEAVRAVIVVVAKLATVRMAAATATNRKT
jgi:hypothetical protein